MAEEDRYLKGYWRWIVISFPIIAIIFAVNQVFDLQFFCGFVLLEPSYHFVIVGFLIPLVFLHRPLKKGRKFFWLDVLFFFIYWASCLYFAWHGYDILTKGYGYFAPWHMIVLSALIWGLLVEAVRRSAGRVLMAVILFFSIYPLFASHMPGILKGVERSFDKTALFHILSTESAMGTLIKIFSNIVFGYILFGVAVVATGGAEFLLNAAERILGRTRGGAAKMAVIGSAFFGSLSGSSIANVVTTGSITIPLMKKSGYEPHFAGAVETCASTAGTLTPPVMGATAFVLASFINMPYVYVALGAAIPAILFYIGLYVQVDGHAARLGLRGLIKDQVTTTTKDLKDGWFYLPTLVVLIYFLFILRWTGEAPYIAMAVMLGLAQIRKKTRFSLESLLQFIENAGKSSAILLAIMSGAGMLLGSFSLTGIAATFSRELFLLAGGSIPLMLVLSALASFILGMGMTAIACYIFLALVVAPTLTMAGLNELAVHLFVLYFGMLSYLTPPVALCAFPAAGIAKASPMKVASTAVRLGAVKYLVPFFFVIDPSLVMQGHPLNIVQAFVSAAFGVFLIGSALEGYLVGIGNIQIGRGKYLIRGILFMSGVILALPGWRSDLIGLGITFATLVAIMLIHRGQVKKRLR